MAEKTLYLDGKAICTYEAPEDPRVEAELCRDLLKARGLWRPATPERTSFSQAVAFAGTAATLYERDLFKLSTSQPGDRKPQSAGPFVVNSAFATELYLKTLGLLHGRKLRGHDLAELFAAIPDAGLRSITEKIHELAPSDSWSSNIRTIDYLRAVMERHRDAFVNWRYLHEQGYAGAFHFGEAIFAMQVLHETCQSKLPA